MSISSIPARELLERLRQEPPPRLIDVRTPAEYREAHVDQADNVPLDQLTAEAARGNSSSPIYVLCQSGMRAMKACQQLAQAGVEVVHVEGGTKACIDAGLPVVRGRKAVSLERQVRIAAGSLVLLGSLLAWFVHPAWVFLPAFIGAGLLFAGLTDTCGMAMLLARMPWNR